jgi:hypothetical protein
MHNKGLQVMSLKTYKEIDISVMGLNCRYKRHTLCKNKNIVAISKYKQQCGSDTHKRMRIALSSVQHLERSVIAVFIVTSGAGMFNYR